MKALSLYNFEKAKMKPFDLENDPIDASSNFETAVICETYQSKFSTEPLAKTEFSTELSSKNEMDSQSFSFDDSQNVAIIIQSIRETCQFEIPTKPLHKEELDFRPINIENSPNVAPLIKSVSRAPEKKFLIDCKNIVPDQLDSISGPE